MAVTSDDDVPTGEAATGHDESPDGDTTAAAMAPATAVPSVVAADDEEEERTVQQQLDPELKSVAARRSASAPSTQPMERPPPAPARPSPPAPPMRMTSRKPTAVGLGSPLPITRPAAGYHPPSIPPAPPTPSSPSSSSSPSPPIAASPVAVPPPPDDDDDSQETIQTEADADDGSITTTAPAPRFTASGAPLPLTLPGTVQIRELPSVDDDDDDPFDETEVRTVVSGLPKEEPASTAPLPGAGRPSAPSTEADESDDSVTTQAPSAVKNARLPEQDDEPKTSPPARLSPASKPIPAAGRRPGEDPPYTLPTPAVGGDDAYDADESVTTRGPAVVGYEDDSVTAQAPVARPRAPQTPIALGMPPTFDDGATKKPPNRGQLGGPMPTARLPSEHESEETESITTEAPGHLTNMLRVIATPEEPLAALELDDFAENKTAVMLGAPVKPAGAPSAGSIRAGRPMLTGSHGPGGARAAALADLREPTSDSGLRVARAEMPSGDHASPSALMAGPGVHPSDRRSGAQPADLRHLRDASPAAFASTEQAFNTPGSPVQQPGMREYDFGATVNKPRYGLLVGLVAALSFTIPLVLFLWLQQAMVEEVPPRTTSEVAPDLVARGDSARPRAIRGGAPSATPSAQTPPMNHGGRPPWFPRRR